MIESDTNSQDMPISGVEPQRRHFLKLRYALKSWFGRFLIYCLSLAVLFGGVTMVQSSFVRRQIYRTADQELASWARQVIEEIGYNDKWDLKGFRNAAIPVSSWYVVTTDGLTVDIEGSIPGVFGKAVPIANTSDNSPQSVVSSTGESWRLLSKNLDGGIVIVGTSALEDTKEADQSLYASLSKFGSTINKATSIRSRDIAFAIDYAVLNSAGDITNAFGGIPLKTSLRILPGPDHCATINADGHSYRLFFESILDQTHHPVGTVIIPRDMTLEEDAMRIQKQFNASLVLAALVLVVLLTFAVLRQMVHRPEPLDLDAALKMGETKTIEFKGSFQWDIILAKQNKELRLAVLKSIAGFLNSEGGHLFVGVAEDRSGKITMRGLGEDLKIFGGSKDKLLLALRDQVTATIGPDFAPFISERFEERERLVFLIVTVLPSPSPAFLRWREKTSFYVREGPKTSDLDTEQTWRYIKNKWR